MKAAVIGTGGIAQTHAEALRMAGISIAAAVDVNADAARTYAPGQYWSADWKPLGDRDVEGVHFVQANNAVSHLAVTKDFRTVKRLGRISDSRFDDRDVILFPERVNGQYVRLSRPVERVGQEYGCTVPSIFISFSDDLMEWGEPQLLMTELSLTGEAEMLEIVGTTDEGTVTVNP